MLDSCVSNPYIGGVKKRISSPRLPDWPFPPSRDVTGRVFGDLVAEQFRGAGVWSWACRCGGHLIAGLDAVESGRMRDCGCGERKRIWRARPGSPALRGGEVFGRLTTDRYIGDGLWVCRCACGSETTVSAGRLRSGAVRSCGCFGASDD